MRYSLLIVTLASLLAMLPGRGSTPRPQATVPTDWKKINLERFLFYAPPEMKSLDVKGIDSAVWGYASSDLELIIDLGRYSGKPSIYEGEPDYREERIKIDGKEATMCFYRFSERAEGRHPYAAAVYFSDVGNRGTKLSFFASCKTPGEQRTAEAIFRTIKLARPAKGKG